MSKYILILASWALFGCGSAPVEDHKAEKSAAPAKSATQEEKADDDSASQVLNKNKKCPKNTKLVKGKCLLQVETTE